MKGMEQPISVLEYQDTRPAIYSINRTIIGLMMEWKEAAIHLDEVLVLLLLREHLAVAEVAVSIAEAAEAVVSIAEAAAVEAAAVEISSL